MVHRVSILLVIIATVASAEEQPLTNQEKGNSKGYPSSGWRPSGPIFRLPERPPLLQNTYGEPQINQRSLSYGPPQLIRESNPEQLENEQHNGSQTGQVLKTSFEGSGAGKTEDQPDEIKLNIFYGAPSLVQDADNGKLHPNSVLSSPKDNIYQNARFGSQVDLTYFPQDTIAAPPNYPAVTYGPPEAETSTAVPTTEIDFTTTELPTSTVILPDDKRSIITKASDRLIENVNSEDSSESGNKGTYYIYHPNGALQKVSYFTKDDQSNMAYSARLKYENVEPIKGPVYTYDPETFVFKRLYKRRR